MRSSAFVMGLATLASAVNLAGLAAAAPARPPASESARRTAADSIASAAARALPLSRAALDEAPLRLGRAVLERGRGNLRGVVENLEALDFSSDSGFAEADRAAFLLGQAHLELGGHERFAALARQVAAWGRDTPYTRWLAFQLALVETDRSQDPRPLIAASERGGALTPLMRYLRAHALAPGSPEAAAEWARLAEADTISPIGRDLAGAALVQLATLAARRGEDPRPLLARVAPGSRYAARARHMAGVAALERGDSTAGAAILTALAAGDSGYAARREVDLALAGQALDQGRWEAAHATYREIDKDWLQHRDVLKRLLASADHDSLWRTWEANASLSPALMLDAGPARAGAQGLADASEDLTVRPEAAIPTLDAPAPVADSPWSVAPPPAEVWRSLAGSARAIGETSHALAETRWAEARERERLDGLRRYLDGGLERARREEADLAAHASLLDSLVRTLADLDARLRAVRDQATRRVLRRTMAILEQCIADLRWLAGMRHFHLEGPNRERAVPAPEGYPLPDSVVAGEEALARAIQSFAQRMADEAPELIARSYRDAWRPGVIDRAAAQDSAAHAALRWARWIASAIDSGIARTASSADLARLAARADSLGRAADALRAAHEAARAKAAREAIARAASELESEREGIDYGLAASAYGMGVRLARPGASDTLVATTRAGAASRPEGAAPDTGAGGAEPLDAMDEPGAVRWRVEAVALHEAFLKAHPESPARGEIRFRLADLLLVEARRGFREQMAAYVADQAAGGRGGVALPVLSHAPALALYRSILAQDSTFEHRDAALFNAGMILADSGDPEAARMFDRLVTAYPGSPYCQEAYLRMGDMEFNLKRYAESIRLYQQATLGADPSLEAIARYKTGWAHYNQDHFAEAALAFAGVLDLYATGKRVAIQADIEGEAEAYLVHSLAGAGGAPAFTAHFERTGARDYEARILMALGQHFRRFGQYPQAAEADELALRRHPDHADALLSAQRLIDTHQRANQPALAREARLGFAARFAPGSPWANAQSADSVRAAGAEFARTALRTVAQEYHLKARESRAAADWKNALDLYEQVLTNWPGDDDAPALALRAGEAATQLGEHARALGHYETAAGSSQDSIATQGLWQRVAVTDAWYESTRGPGSSGGAAKAATGNDSLARAVLAEADRLRARFPNHPQSADLLWRQGNLAFAHGWLEVSAGHFGTLASAHPADKRAPRAAILKADAFYRLGRFDVAGAAYEEALVTARAAGADSLRRRAEQAIPVSYYRHAEAAVAEDSSRFERHAGLFQQVASRFPRYEHAHLAQYRAGLAWGRAGKHRDAVRAYQAVIDSFPNSTYVRDAHLEIARAWEADGDKEKSAAAYARFAERFPADKGAADSWLKSADLYAGAGKEDKALEIRLAYVKRYPNDFETAMEVYEALAVKQLATVGPEKPISSMLPPEPEPVKAKTTAKGKKAAPAAKKGKKAPAKPPAKPAAPAKPAEPPYLAEYMKLAAAHPSLASRGILAQVRYLQAEEARPAYEALRIRQPLPPSIAAKQKSLDHLMGLYRKSVDLGVPEWTHAATYRIGEALVGFGDALQKSERPADLNGDGLAAYEEVLSDRAGQFSLRGENVWSDLLRQKGKDSEDDPWLVKARSALWSRLGDRFAYVPEADHPLVAAREPKGGDGKKDDEARDAKQGGGRRDSTERQRAEKRPQSREERP